MALNASNSNNLEHAAGTEGVNVKISQNFLSVDHPRTTLVDTLFCSCDLDLHPMTLIYEHDLDFPKMYRMPKMKFLDQGLRKFEHAEDRQTDGCDRTHYHAVFVGGKTHR